MDATDIKWNDFKQAVELDGAYLELAMKLNMFCYAITGARSSRSVCRSY